MLNLYKYYDSPESLPLYDRLAHTMRVAAIHNSGSIKLRDLDKGDLEALMPIISRTPWLANKYAREVLHGRWPEAEPIIMKVPNVAYSYVKTILAEDPEWPYPNGKWPDAEPYIMKNPFSAVLYAKHVLKHRWKEAEPVIKTDEYHWHDYIRYFEVD
jgi:hypothetical protein